MARSATSKNNRENFNRCIAALARYRGIRHVRVMPRTDSPAATTSIPTLTQLPLEEALLSVLSGADRKTLGAPEIAHAIAGGGDWHSLLSPIRKAAVSLAQSGRLIIYRHGKPVDPNDFRGVYRLGLPRQD